MVDLFCASWKRSPASIILDIDDTFDAVHGRQQLSLFQRSLRRTLLSPIHIYEAPAASRGGGSCARARRPTGVEVRTIRKHVIARAFGGGTAQGANPSARRQPLRPVGSDGLVRIQRC